MGPGKGEGSGRRQRLCMGEIRRGRVERKWEKWEMDGKRWMEE